MDAILSGKAFSNKAEPLPINQIMASGFVTGGGNKPTTDNLTLKLAAAALSGASQGECSPMKALEDAPASAFSPLREGYEHSSSHPFCRIDGWSFGHIHNNS